MSAKCHVWTAPSWQGLSSRTQHWSVQPCVRPVDAVHMTAGHNALRGSGPGQKRAFDNALALVGCPDRRSDRLCITCCSPSQHSHHIGCPMRSRSRRERGGFFVAFAPSHHRPRHPGDLVGERDGRDLGWSARQQRREPPGRRGAFDHEILRCNGDTCYGVIFLAGLDFLAWLNPFRELFRPETSKRTE